jgi:hypothetical protein
MGPTDIVKIKPEKRIYRCLSCGTTENMGRRKYCTADCRQRLRLKLDGRMGLVQALNTRFATFYFSEAMIMMDLLPYGTREIFSFFYPRSPGRKPAEDFGDMANLLGTLWWEEKRRTNRRHLAAERVLNEARRNINGIEAVKPPRSGGGCGRVPAGSRCVRGIAPMEREPGHEPPSGLSRQVVLRRRIQPLDSADQLLNDFTTRR